MAAPDHSGAGGGEQTKADRKDAFMFAGQDQDMQEAPRPTAFGRLDRRTRRALAALALPLGLGLAGCEARPDQVGLPIVAADTATDIVAVPLLGRGIGDTVYSVASGRDCSVVRLDRGQSYCKPKEASPPPQQFCTRSLGVVDCWTNPEALNDGPPRGVADGPTTLTPEQEANRTARWPKLY